MTDVPQWLEICKTIGAGIAFVAVPALVILWREWRADTKARAEIDRNNVVVLADVARVLKEAQGVDKENVASVLKAVTEARQEIMERLENMKPSRRTSA